jgi:hypothetical protein
MGILSNLRRSNEPRLPVYESLPSPQSPTKERYSTSDDSSPDISDDDFSDSSSLSAYPRASSSRHTSDSLSSTASMLPRNPSSKSFPPIPKRKPPTRRYALYRLPNKVVRYLCIGMMTTICLFIFSLVRASQMENKRILAGKVEKKPPPPPVWEGFKFLTRYYGGIRTLVPVEDNVPQYPRDEDEQPYNPNATAKINSRGFPSSMSFSLEPRDVETCFLDVHDRVRVPAIHYYKGRPNGFPEHVVGAYDVLDLAEDICYDRYGRFGPYGFGYSVRSGGLGVGEQGEREGADEVFNDVPQVEWKDIDWAEVQKRCYGKNAERYKPFVSLAAPPRGLYIGGGEKAKANPAAVQARSEPASTPETIKSSKANTATPTSAKISTPKPTGTLPRTAFVVRAWDTYTWREEDILNLRSIISEVSLASGGAYDIHLLVEVKNDAANPIWADDKAYRSVINASVPAEFQGLVTLWSQTQMLSVYQGIHDLYTKGPEHPVHGAYRGLQMAMQWFAHTHQEYEYFWQWEMDIRYTGHYLDLISKMENWAKQQPRKGLWERNARFYVPSVHGTWEDFRQMVRVQSETPIADPLESIPGRKNASPPKKEQIVWGPLRPSDSDFFETDNDPTPPTSYDRDRYTWGVDEEADLLTLNPLFDPDGTSWGLAEDIAGYNRSSSLPRRAQIITASRMSRRLLTTMHRETAHKKHHAFPEMWPATVALHHGLKAVYVPHPVYIDREWPVEYLSRVLNGGRNGASGGSRTSVFGDREHNLRGMSWFYNSGFGGNLYRRWLGLKVNNDGGEEFEKVADETRDDLAVGSMRGGEGRMCLPPMLLHPVKEVEVPVEAGAVVEVIESDPSA